MQRVWVCHIVLDILPLYMSFIKGRRYNVFIVHAITLVKTKKKQKVDWAQIIFNSLCSELDRWYKYVKENKGDKKDTCQFALVLAKIFLYLFVHKKKQSVETTGQG